MCDIRRIRNPNTKSYTFRQRHSSGYIQRRLITFSYLMFYKNLQKTIMFWLFFRLTMFSLFSKSEGTRGKSFWKHNNSLCQKSTYINSMKKHISTLKNLKNENITDEQSVWEYLKYKIGKFSKKFTKEAVPSLVKFHLQL